MNRLCGSGSVSSFWMMAAAVILCPGSSSPLLARDTVGTPWTGGLGITESVDQIMAREAELPPPDPDNSPRAKPGRVHPLRPQGAQNHDSPATSHWPPTAEDALDNPLPQGHSATVFPNGRFGPPGDSGQRELSLQPNNPQSVATSFLGVQLSESTLIPPDSMGAVGPTQVVMFEKGRIKLFDKAGNANAALNTTDLNFFNSVRNGAGVTDPQVRFDRTSNRWFVAALNTPASGANREMLAVSSGPTITGQVSFTFYFFQQDQGSPAGDTGNQGDFASLGVDANACYIGMDIYDSTGSFIGCSAFVVRKSSVLSGGPIVVSAFRNLLLPTTGPLEPRGVDNDDPAATEGYFIGVDFASFGVLEMRRVSSPGGTPSLSDNLSITVPTTAYPLFETPALGSNPGLDALDDRLFAAKIHKNRLTGLSTLWTSHNIQTAGNGIASNSGGRNSSRWYEIQDLTSTPSLRQSGTVYDTVASNARSFWIPSMAMSGQGHAAIGTTYAGAADRAGVAVAGRLFSDTLGGTQPATLAVVSGANYNPSGDSTPRHWGEYSETCVDPTDDMTLWTFQEYCNATDSWGVRAVKLAAPPPATPANCAPSSAAQNSHPSVVLTGSSINGSGFFDPDATFPNHIAATVNGNGVTVSSITLTDPTHITLNLTVAAGATLGSRTITVTNPDGQAATSASGVITIIAGSTCPADVNHDNVVNVSDLLIVINAWGSCTGCAGDINHDNAVNVSDLLLVINAWGNCS